MFNIIYQNLVKSLSIFCQIFNKNLNQQLIQWYIQQMQFWHILSEWSILGKTRLSTHVALMIVLNELKGDLLNRREILYNENPMFQTVNVK